MKGDRVVDILRDIEGGIGDDALEIFSVSIVSLGRNYYYKVLESPEVLRSPPGEIYVPEIWIAANRVSKKKFGRGVF